MKVGLMGCGVIGGALKTACEVKKIPIAVYDKFKPGMQDFSVVLDSDLIFLCLPTPTVNGQQDDEAVAMAVQTLESSSYKGAVIIRSTVLPGTTDQFQKVYPKVALGHCPEFLTAATPFEDLIKQPAVLVGSSNEKVRKIAAQFWNLFDKKIPCYVYDSPFETEMAKYIHNCYLATKVSFFNDVHALCEKLNISYHNALHGAFAIGQVTKGHTQVPGPDGKFGFGGMCFVKDTAALLALAKQLGISADIVEATVNKNKRVRPDAYNGKEETGVR